MTSTPDGFVTAFMRAFEAWEKAENDLEPEDADYQFALCAFEGAKDRARHARDKSPDHLALAVSVAYEEAGNILANGYRLIDQKIDGAERVAMEVIKDTLDEVWQHLKPSVKEARPYAYYVGLK